MKVQVPLYQGVNKIGVNWNVGDYATYQVYEDENHTKKMGTHKVHLKEIVDINGTPHYRIEISLESDGGNSTLTFHSPTDSLTCDLSKAKEIMAKTRFGSFKLSYFESRPGESLVASSKETLTIGNREFEAERYTAKYSDGQPETELWINPKIGPYGLLKGKVWLDSAYFYYVLTDYGPQKD